MHVLVTGGAGFIGSHLTQTLLDRGDSVALLDNLSTGSYANIARFRAHERFSFAIDDINNTQVLDRLASEADAIVHLAAAVGVQLVVERPTETIETNVLGTHAVLAAARRYRCRTLIASTSEVYGKGVKIPFAEEDDLLLGPSSRSRWSYAASKLLDEFLGLAAHREYGLPVTILRFFNTVGPGQTGRYGMVVPRFVRAALAGQPIPVFGDGEQSRCFCHVGDTVRALVALMDKPERTAGEVFNIGSGEEVTINELAQAVVALTGSVAGIEHIPYSEAYAPGFEDMRRRVPDTNKLYGVTGWQAAHGLDRILADVLAWEQAHADMPRAGRGVARMSAYTETQAALRAAPRTWLVTGVAGFIGSHLLETLLGLGQQVVGLDNFATGYAHNLAQVQEAVGEEAWARFRMIEGDIRDFGACQSAVGGVDFVLHQAALGSVPRSLEQPRLYHDVNVTGFVNMLEAARGAGVGALCLCVIQRRLWRRAAAARHRGSHRQAAFALCADQAARRAVCATLRKCLRLCRDRPALLQHLWPAPGPQGGLRRRHPPLGGCAAARRALRH